MDLEEDKALLKTVTQLKRAVERYTEAEQIISNYLKAPWWKKLFFSRVFSRFIIKQSINYK